MVNVLVTSGWWLQSDGFLRKGLEHRLNSGLYVRVFPSWEKTKHKTHKNTNTKQPCAGLFPTASLLCLKCAVTMHVSPILLSGGWPERVEGIRL